MLYHKENLSTDIYLVLTIIFVLGSFWFEVVGGAQLSFLQSCNQKQRQCCQVFLSSDENSLSSEDTTPRSLGV